jgi:hypothetical protein
VELLALAMAVAVEEAVVAEQQHKQDKMMLELEQQLADKVEHNQLVELKVLMLMELERN